MQQLTNHTTKKTEEPSEAKLADPDNPANWRDHVIICGLHQLGYRIIKQLRAAGVRMVVVDDKPDSRLMRQTERMGVKVIREDSRIPESLVEAGIYNASAIIACEDNDLHNLETVLVANDLAPDIRTVASFFNQRVGEQFTRAINNIKALSLAEKAGPAFLEACVNTSLLHLFSIEGQDVAVVEATVPDSGTIAQFYGVNSPLVLRESGPLQQRAFKTSFDPNYSVARTQPADPNDWIICPHRQHPVQPGHSVIMAGRVAELRKLPGVKLAEADVLEAISSLEAMQDEEVDLPGKEVRERKLRRLHRIQQARRFISGVLSGMERPFRFAILFVFMVMFLSTVLLRFTYHSTYINPQGQAQEFSWLDALYFTVTIITTAGFGDYNFAQQEWGLKLYGVFLTLIGAASVSVVYAFVTNYIINRRIQEALGRNKVTNLENHVVICGMGSVGYQVMLGLLKQGKQVAVIEKSEQGRFVNEARSLNVPIILGDAKLPQALKAVNIHKARAIAILTSDDLANLETALSAHAEFHHDETNKDKSLPIVLRVFDNGLAERIAKNFDIHTIYSASALAAPYFVGAALDYEVISTFYLERLPFVVARLVIQPGSELDGLTVKQLQETTRMLVIARASREAKETGHGNRRAPARPGAEPIFHPDPELRLYQGDALYVIGPYDRVTATYHLNRPRQFNKI